MKKDSLSKKEKIQFRRICIIVICMILLFVIVGGYERQLKRKKLEYSQEYVVGNENIKGNVDIDMFMKISDKFEIGANSYGYAVFKNPTEAFKELKLKYYRGINLIKNEFKLEPLNQNNYKEYGTYGNQVTGGDEEEKEQAYFVSGFMDIYDNSYQVD